MHRIVFGKLNAAIGVSGTLDLNDSLIKLGKLGGRASLCGR